MLIRNKFNGFSATGQRLVEVSSGGGGGGGAPQQTTSYQTNLPEYAQPYVMNMLGAAQNQLFTTTPGQNGQPGEITGFRPYTPYSTDPTKYFAGPSSLQQQTYQEAGGMQTPGQFTPASGLAQTAGQQALGTQGLSNALAGEALGYGQAGAGYGQVGQMYGAQGAQQAQRAAMQAQRAAGMYGGMGAGFGAQAAGLSPEAQRAGAEAAALGMQGLGYGGMGAGLGQQAANMAGMGFGAGQQFMRGVTDPSQVQAFMSPYQQGVTDVAKAAAVREAQMAENANRLASARQGTYGGARQTLASLERERNLLSNLSNIQAQGSQSAYDRALGQMQFGSNLGLQGLGAGVGALQAGMQGAQTGLSGLGTAMQGQQARLQGLQQAGQLLGQGMQGAQVGLSGVGQQLAGGQLGLQGTAQGIQGAQAGMQGAGLGLQGVGQATQAGQLGLQGAQAATQAAGTLGQLGSQQQQADLARIGLQNQLGQAQQQYQQNIINQAIQDYATAQQYPLMQLSAMSSLLRGLPLQSATTQTYQAAPSMTSQLAGLGTAAVGAYGLGSRAGLFKAGGKVKEYKYGGAIPSDKLEAMANKLSKDQLEAQLRDPSLDDMERQIFAAELKERMSTPSMGIAAAPAPNMDDLGMAGGGIVAFARGDLVEDPLAYLSGFTPENLAADELRREKAILKGIVAPKAAPAAAPVAPAPAAAPDSGLAAVSRGKYDDLIEEGLKGMREQSPTAGLAQKDLERLRGDISKSEERDPYMALIRAGLRMAGGKSQYALQNIAEGAEAGLSDFAKSKEAQRADKKLLIAQQSALEQAEYARKTGNLNALIQAQTRLDAVKAQRENLGAQKEMAILSAREKARGDMIQRLMYQNQMDEDTATAIANRAYPSTIGTATTASQARPQLTAEQQKLLNKYK